MIPFNINTLPVLEQYKIYYNHYQKKYGKVAIMYQYGTVYNFFGTENFGNIKNVAYDLSIRLTYTDKSKPGKNTDSNPMMAGVPICAWNNYVEKLLINDYVVVKIQEFKSKKAKDDKLIPREVTAIYTPGTYIDEFSSSENFIVQIYIKGYKDRDYEPMSIGMSAIDINTGYINYYEVYNTPEDEGYALDEVYRYIHAHSPKEILVHYQDTEFVLDRTSQYIIKNQEIPKEIVKEGAQISFLENIFSKRGISDVIDYLDLEMKMSAKMSLCLLLYYVFDHNKTLVENLKKPEIWFSERYLLLANNAIEQLDIMNKKPGKFENVLNLINFTSTTMGKRLLRHRLINPLRDIKCIKKRYEWVDKFWEWKKYEDILEGMVDMTRDHRKIERGVLSPLSLSFLLDSYESVLKLMEICPEGFIKKKYVKRYIEEMLSTFDREECRKYDSIDSILSNIFVKGFSEKFDKYGEIIRDGHDKLENILEDMKSSLSKLSKPVIEKDDSLGYYIRMTQKQANVFKNLIILPTRVKKHVWVQTKEFKKISDEITNAEESIKYKLEKYYLKFLNYIGKEYRDVYTYIVKFVSECDVYKSSAKCAEKYKFCKPVVKNKENGYISCKNMRHPLVERMNTMYIPHTFKIDQNNQGSIIYGLNASGKTVFMKALGVNLVLAQAGFYVASENFVFSPFENIQTRILGNDNIFRGFSSFAVEMSELRGIIARAGSKSFVLGDEVCHGTETISGMAIVCSAIIELMETNTNFIFASHLHELVNIEEIKNMKNLGVYHIKVERDGRKLVYKRTLEKGPGDSLYGLEVARAMNLQEHFIDRANKIRKRIIDDQLVGKQSRYHYKLFLKNCAICKEKAVHTHHIKFQSEADENGFINHFHKNNIHNLVGLCEKCHISVHKGNINIYGYDETSEGLLLNYSKQ